MEKEKPQLITDINKLSEYTEEILTSLPTSEKAVVLALSGDLGVGKTTFVKMLAEHLGVTETVTSPTFTILKRYDTTSEQFPVLFHMDAYRLESDAEAKPLRLEEIFETKGVLFCIEWAEKIKNILPEDTIFYTLSITKEGVHTIQRENHS